MNDEFAKELEHLANLVDQGKLPVTAIPRLFYFGHEFIEYYQPIRDYQCAECGHIESFDKSGPDACSKCRSDQVYNITPAKIVWTCSACKHKWEGKDGRTCPSCGDYK